ncbi:MAG: LutB/LldF family L-lactate oxidation iron-sulfur protein [Phototrophicaceae bacterium]
MEVQSKQFIALADIGIHNTDQRAAVLKGTTNAHTKRLAAMYASGQEYGEALRQQAAEARRRALRNLPDLLEQAEANMTANGMHVLWAESPADANRLMLEIAARHDVQRVAKAKSMLTEELGVNHALEAAGIEVTETDLGEWIIQLNDEAPSHIIAPVIHKSKESIVEVFREKVNYTGSTDATEMAAFAREKLRRVFLEADMGISGGNFIVAETGTFGLVTNEGNGRMVTAMPRVHVAFIGIEKVVETLDDYSLLTQLVARAGTGQVMTVYTQMIGGPRRDGEPDGPDHVYVILVDNGRTKIYATEYAEALACIRCGACQNACPVYQNTGGHAYGWVYGGPIGAVITPLLTGLENASPLPYASTLCGACKQACPVDIDLPRMLLDLRRDIVDAGISGQGWGAGLFLWGVGNRNPALFGFGGFAARTAINSAPIIKKLLPPPLSGWTDYRDFPDFAPKPFRDLWQERQKRKSNGANGADKDQHHDA